MKSHHPEKFEGVFTALVTPFDSKNHLDKEAFQKHLQSQLEAGLHGVVPCGTTGETPCLSDREKTWLIETCVKTAAKKATVIAGTGSNDTSKTIDQSLEAQELGAHAVLVVTPYYNKPSQKGLVAHYTAVANALKIPVILYNVPSRTGISLDADSVGILSRHVNIAGIKEASGNLNLLLDMQRKVQENRKTHFTFLTGDDPTYWPFLACGGNGVISVASNILPRSVLGIYEDWKEGRTGTGLHLFQILEPFFKSLFIETNPVPTKTLLAHLGKMEKKFRLPLVEMAADKESLLYKNWDSLPVHIKNDKPRELL